MYDVVSNTTAITSMNLLKLGLPHQALLGIRELSYDRASKIAIKFKSRWWKSIYREQGGVDGISNTYLPIRNVVCPSWDAGKDAEGYVRPAVLMVSYIWAMGTLIPHSTKVPSNRDEPSCPSRAT
ncbi:L-amino acid oxidase [Colletotrichum graminicola]|uniref:L-amino acid oxidase n=1 Tax=Colletotrichum graminicola (strain M1.001 / M2 / FGSC 10212) TaxID=645133 RepID=E3QW43_COLGM|nr:L-amino acid oxidase [Colletotrichum graminicola M1.001]EFQ35081.1 L-amino acid oxidase [Colletotrichum graminicola M1.001]WDK20451.1 L-amino acid oxidase [Colletotrichum graminicola]